MKRLGYLEGEAGAGMAAKKKTKKKAKKKVKKKAKKKTGIES